MHYGFYGLDSPEILVEKVVQKMYDEDKDLEAILINGDFIAHGHAFKN